MPLTPSQVAKAVYGNSLYGRQLGWASRYDQVLQVVGLESPPPPTAERFAQAVADWQADHRPLDPDGIIGPNTWKKLGPEVRKLPGGAPAPPPEPEAPPTGAGPPWLQYAQAEMTRWDTEIASWAGTKNNVKKAEQYVDWDEAYFMASPYWGAKSHADGATPATPNLDWCAAFANWCLHRAGYSHTGSAGAASFLSPHRWRFDALTEPRQGCVVVPGNTEAGHVTFLWSWTKLPSNPKGSVEISGSNGVRILGGNQGNTVKISTETRKLLAARGQNGVTSPYLWPLRGGGGCTITSVPTDADHFCGLNPV